MVRGMAIRKKLHNGPAARSKLMINDIITQINDKEISDCNDIKNILDKNYEKSLSFKILRDKKIMEILVEPMDDISYIKLLEKNYIMNLNLYKL